MGCGLEQGQLDLQRRVREQADDLRLRGDFRWHQIEDRQSQRSDVLCDGAMLVHDKDVLAGQNFTGRQSGWDFDWHIGSFVFCG